MMNAMTRKRLALVAALLCLIYMGVVELRAPYETPYSRGKALVVEMGCVSCHGTGSSGLTPNPSADINVPDGVVPALVGSELSAADFQGWVLDGSRRDLGESQRWREQSAARAINMPAYRDYLSSDQVSDILAWTVIEGHQVPTGETQSGDRWARAEALAEATGCFACHGPLGQGGTSNPGSFSTKIPGLTGEDFAHLSNGADRAAVKEWILDGVSQRFLDENPFAFMGEWFLRRQRTQMPAFGAVLSEEEVELLVDYCLHLYELGPLGHEAYSGYSAGRSPTSLQVTTAHDSHLSAASMPAEVAKIFSRACLRCHGAKKQKSAFRMDSRAALYSGGEISEYLETPVIALDDPEGSLLLKFILAEEESLEEEIFPMPPDEKDRLSEDEIDVIRAWLASGAPWAESQILHDTYTK
jgi:mono/diheme cytochrome c family protein